MNNVILTGRLTADPKTFDKVTLFTVAVKRDYKSQSGEYETDFINCKAFGKTAELINKHFVKGKPITITGGIRTGSYEKDGVTHYTTDVVANSVEFVLSDNTRTANAANVSNYKTAQPVSPFAPFDNRYL